ncbi:DEAD/DEAH box helicase family protein [Sporosarcina jiandibaonis]|uniref:DEAD/DEAH box helicase family protein n=1 Tax=Sporosarcina jiandibaonis TaxID=2715535 RepID=UPI0015581D29|nr:DEAD/DEAH box helicase family protein [Sporosarcina jiandibaonis]
MKTFPKGIQFCYEWRSYQKRVLNELNAHMKSKKLHLIAPPGSGKTVLGLEVMLRMNKATLIVAPTLAIKQQWKDRFTELFLKDEQPDWISMDIKNPKFITITTYQSLHSIYKENDYLEEEDDELVDDAELLEEEPIVLSESARIQQKIKAIGFGTLILDEAHHLRTAWWHSMMQLRNELQNSNVVSLTATPPFDVSASEWQRYIQLCGTIDIEISVPELVKAKELCPHQDYVHFSAPQDEELKMILHFRDEAHKFIESFIHDERSKNLLESHPWLMDPMEYVGEILEQPAYFSSILIFLNHVGSDKYLDALPIIGVSEKDMPALSSEWLEELLTGILYTDKRISAEKEFRKNIKDRLARMGAIERRKVRLQSTSGMNRKLTQSVSKLNSIREIIKYEKTSLQEKLRMVILTDYIRLTDLPNSTDDELPLTRIGVVPIFEMIRRSVGIHVKAAILTGSLVIIPKNAQQLVEDIAIREDCQLRWKELTHDPTFIRTELNAGNRQQVVSILTEVFTKGEIDVLIGTAALLGEGWDAPCVNSLIMASYVGSFMQSNQMRGRAIRVDRNNPEKTSSIWHLVCVNRDIEDRGYDYDLMDRRFRSLVGVGVEKDVIETGIARLRLDYPPFTLEKIRLMNAKTFARSSNLDGLFVRWERAIFNGSEMTEEIVADRKSWPRPFYLQHSLRGLLWFAGFTTVGGIVDAAQILWKFDGVSIGMGLFYGIILGFLFGLPSILRVGKLYFRNPSVESSMKEIGEALYVSLHNAKLVSTPYRKGMIHVTKDRLSEYTCWLMDGTTHDKNVFMKALKEFIDPIENPRYLLIRRAGKLIKRRDVHAVPQELGRKKEHAEFLQIEWKKRVGEAELVYTRTFEGRKELLSARLTALSAAFVEKADRISGWR